MATIFGILLIVSAIAFLIIAGVTYFVLKFVFAVIWAIVRPARLGHTPPPLPVAYPNDAFRQCANPQCTAEIVPEARFCGRCGSVTPTDRLLKYEPLPDATYIATKRQTMKRKGMWRINYSVCKRPTVLPPRRCRVSCVA